MPYAAPSSREDFAGASAMTLAGPVTYRALVVEYAWPPHKQFEPG